MPYCYLLDIPADISRLHINQAQWTLKYIVDLAGEILDLKGKASCETYFHMHQLIFKTPNLSVLHLKITK